MSDSIRKQINNIKLIQMRNAKIHIQTFEIIHTMCYKLHRKLTNNKCKYCKMLLKELIDNNCQSNYIFDMRVEELEKELKKAIKKERMIISNNSYK